MLDIKFIRENKDLIKQNCENRGVKCDIDRLLVLDNQRKELLQEIEKLRTRKNLLSDLFKRSSGRN